MAKKQPKPDTEEKPELLSVIGEALLEKKADHIKVLDVRSLTTVTDYFIVCEATSDTQIKAIAANVMEKTKSVSGEPVWKREGLETNRWVVLDYVTIVVHIFLDELRSFYALEKMWNDAVISEIKD